MPDKDGYPTEEELARITSWPVDNQLGWFAFIKSCWWAADWGWSEDDECDEGKDRRAFFISTGGWSGNESIIEAMQGNRILWSMTWRSHRRGGHWEFDVRPAGRRGRVIFTDPREISDGDIYEEMRCLENSIRRLDQQRWPVARRLDMLRSERIRRLQERTTTPPASGKEGEGE